uniref:Putative transposase n=1 Tax=Lutzomyia longipalpis TaxID=7200 RepID=A0A1B0GH08_LUTLO
MEMNENHEGHHGDDVAPAFANEMDKYTVSEQFPPGRVVPYQRNFRLTAYHQVENEDTPYLLKKVKLKKIAVPTVFPGVPHPEVVIPNPPVPRPLDADEENMLHIERLNNKMFAADAIMSFMQLTKDFQDKLGTEAFFSNYDFKVNNQHLVFYCIEDSDPFGVDILSRIIIDDNLKIQIFIRNEKLTYKDLSWVLGKNMQLRLWSELSNILARYKNPDVTRFETPMRSYLNQAADNIKSALHVAEEDFHHLANLEFLLNQVELIIGKTRNYNKTTLILSFVTDIHSSATYRILRNTFILPTERHLKNITNSLNVSPDCADNNDNYLRGITKNLSEMEKKMTLVVDEIYVKEKIEYKSGKLYGFTNQKEEKDQEVAKTILAFMLKSTFGHFEEVFQLIPSKKLIGDDLKDLILRTINKVQSINNIEILAVVADNNKINVNAYDSLKNDPKDVFFTNPIYPNKKIFLLYDSVHLLKNIRNNWIRFKGKNVFEYPDFESFDTKKADFWDLRNLYLEEANQITRKAHKLNHKSLFPNSLERQKVSLVTNVFDESTVEALKEKPKYRSTGEFMEIILHWWSIINVKSRFKGVRKRYGYFDPISSVDHDNLQFLKKFAIWLTKWDSLTLKLTEQTHKALYLTTISTIEIIEYSFQHFSIQYFLPGKLQSDCIEARFGKYRYLSGCTYHVSVCNVFENEKKLRIREILKNEFSLSEFKKEECQLVEIDPAFSALLNNNLLEDLVENETDSSYVCGYAAHNVWNKIPCQECRSLFAENKGGLTSDEYFNNRQRGGLIVASSTVMELFRHMTAIFFKINQNSDLYKKFLSSNTKYILSTLTLESLEQEGKLF